MTSEKKPLKELKSDLSKAYAHEKFCDVAFEHGVDFGVGIAWERVIEALNKTEDADLWNAADWLEVNKKEILK